MQTLSQALEIARATTEIDGAMDKYAEASQSADRNDEGNTEDEELL